MSSETGESKRMTNHWVERSWALARALNAQAEISATLFTPRFLLRAGAEEVGGILARLHSDHGAVQAVELVGPIRAGIWVLEWRYQSGTRQLQHLGVEASPPHRIGALRFGPPWNPDERDLAEPARTPFRLPFRGRWHVTWGGRTLVENYHRESKGQRFAYDFSIVRGDTYCHGDGARNEDHYCFGEDILAPADGRVLQAVDGVPDNRPWEKNEEQPVGNFVLIQHAEGEFSLLAHLKEGSVGVGIGQSVNSDEKIGECGNSGRSSKPHLHFHVQDSPNLQAGRGIPPRFVRIRSSTGEHDEVEPRRGEWVENR